jgi:hypothetical protein
MSDRELASYIDFLKLKASSKWVQNFDYRYRIEKRPKYDVFVLEYILRDKKVEG